MGFSGRRRARHDRRRGLVLRTTGSLILTVPIASPWMLGALAVLLGVSLRAFPLINALASTRWGAPRAGESLGWITMVGQLAGAVSLSVSGFLALNATSRRRGQLSEFTGIWLFVGCLVALHQTKPSPFLYFQF